MRQDDLKLPSNFSFGLLFAIIFFGLSIYAYYSFELPLVIALFLVSVCFLVLAFIRSELLTPLNRAWMKLGVFLGMIVSPIVLGVIFFGILTPLALLQRAFRRDELRLRQDQESHWDDQKTHGVHKLDFKKQY